MGHTVPKLLVTFAAGGVGYCALETLWRGRTHPSMALCGGTVLAVFTKMVRRGGSRLGLCLRGCALITGCELLCGLVFNRDRQVWDYSRLPGNFRGRSARCFPPCGFCCASPCAGCAPCWSGTWPSLTRGERGDYNKDIPYCAAQGGIGPSCGKRGESPPQQPLL